ncbi:uncharacterized protein LOC129595797 [Paramacrobiotus metropolitanus]|uniref:uncharacterized protein LOC129595797 n=1 Tax=Paramacrobiotus metropolitanus TaxID=2943436 RepID=UPI002445C94F|nr:uncharacterized protein LOC129595797 [Paramacrobiotus metropolitanus]
MRRMQLPDDFPSMSAKELRKQLGREKVRCFSDLGTRNIFGAIVEIVNGSLFYVDHQTVPELAAAELDAFHVKLIERLLSITKTSEASEVSKATVIYAGLPPELWLEVFSHLSTRTQAKLRTVCLMWNHVLNSPLLTANVCTQCSECSSDRGRLDYPLTSPIFKCLSASTRRIIVADGCERLQIEGFLKIADMIRYVAEANPEIRLTAIYLVAVCISFATRTIHYKDTQRDVCGVHFKDSNNLPNRGEGLSDSWMAAWRWLPCDRVYYVRCTHELFIHDRTPDRRLPSLFFDARVIRLMNTDDLECAMWEAMEMNLPATSDEQMQTLSKFLAWIANEQIASSKDEAKRQDAACEVLQILCSLQTSDPRPSTYYRGKKWCVDGSRNVQPEKLSRTALGLLVLLACNKGADKRHPFSLICRRE